MSEWGGVCACMQSPRRLCSYLPSRLRNFAEEVKRRGSIITMSRIRQGKWARTHNQQDIIASKMFLCGECVGWMGCESEPKTGGRLFAACIDDKFDRNIAPTRERWKQAGSERHQCHNHRQHRQYRWRLLIIMENKCELLVCLCMKFLLGGDFGWSYFVIYRSATPNENAWPILFFSATGCHTNTRRAHPLCRP